MLPLMVHSPRRDGRLRNTFGLFVYTYIGGKKWVVFLKTKS
jgi:hypothetical protein